MRAGASGRYDAAMKPPHRTDDPLRIGLRSRAFLVPLGLVAGAGLACRSAQEPEPGSALAFAATPGTAEEPAGPIEAPPRGTAPETDVVAGARPGTVAPGFDRARFGIYTSVPLAADIDHLSGDQRALLGLLIEAAEVMDGLYWKQAFGARADLIDGLADPDLARFAEINYGPWDRLGENAPFVAGYGPKPTGARFYPEDMTREEFEAWAQPGKDGQYSLVARGADGRLRLVPYSTAYAGELTRAADLLRLAADLARDEDFARYLELRADALLSDDYLASDLAWMDCRSNPIELVIGPIETYEDQLFGYRAAFEAYVLIKDLRWSRRLERYAAFLPELQRGLPVPPAYRREEPGSEADLNAYDVVYVAGDCNAGAKTIAINLPNDERVQLERGTRRLQLKNAMRAKFDRILVPLADVLIAPDQRGHITFEAFFANTMFHEVAHGLGIKNTIDGKGTVRATLKEAASPLEEGKADILGLYMITHLHDQGQLEDGELLDNYVTFLASIFRSVRFGASSAHGRANMMRFNHFARAGAFTRDEANGTYRVELDAMRRAVDSLSAKLLTIQGDGDYAGAVALLEELGVIGPELQADLDRLSAAGIPVDIVFEQGPGVLGL